MNEREANKVNASFRSLKIEPSSLRAGGVLRRPGVCACQFSATGLLVACAKDADEDKSSHWGLIALPGWGVEAAVKQFKVNLHDGLQP